MTIKNPKTIQGMIRSKGMLEGIQFCSIWEYKGENGEVLYALFDTPNHDMYSSPYVHDPKLLWPKE